MESIVNRFLEKGIIKEYSEGVSTGGRKPLILRINEENIGMILGVSLAPRFIQISVGDINGKVLKTISILKEKNCPKKKIIYSKQLNLL